MEAFNRLRRFLAQGFIPVTKSLLILGVGVFLGYHLLSLFNWQELYSLLILTPGTVFSFPWTLIVYPLVNLEPFSLIFALLWLWFVGGSLERSWGSWKYGVFSLLVTLVSGLLMVIAGKLVLDGALTINGFWIPLVALTWAWAGIYPEREVLFWGIIPLRANWLAWINAAFVFFNYATPIYSYHWLVGIASVSGIAVFYLFRGQGLFSPKIGASTVGRRFSWRDWLEKRRQKARRKKLKIIKH